MLIKLMLHRANATKPVDGYGGPPTGPLNAVRHVFDDPIS